MKNEKALILKNRSAFALFKSQGIRSVEQYFPESVDFVNKNSTKTLKKVTEELEEKLNPC
jgi:ERCC4-related helicase